MLKTSSLALCFFFLTFVLKSGGGIRKWNRIFFPIVWAVIDSTVLIRALFFTLWLSLNAGDLAILEG